MRMLTFVIVRVKVCADALLIGCTVVREPYLEIVFVVVTLFVFFSIEAFLFQLEVVSPCRICYCFCLFLFIYN